MVKTLIIPIIASHRRLIALVIGVSIFSVGAAVTAAIVSGSSVTGVSSHVTFTQLTLNRPTVSQGDLMIASIAIQDGNIPNVTAPSGWTQIIRTDNDVNVALITYKKIAGASEPSTYTWTIDEQTKAVGGITPYSGVDSGSPVDVYAGNVGFGLTATTSIISASNPNEMIIAVYANDVAKSFSTPTGLSEKYDLSHTNAGPTIAYDEALQVTSGTVSSKLSTISGNKSRNWASQVIAIKTQGIPAPFAYWKLDGSSNDAAGSNNGSDIDITYSAGCAEINQGACFNGSSSRIDLGHMLSGQPNHLSVAAWVKTSEVPFDGTLIWSQRGLHTAQAVLALAANGTFYLSELGADGLTGNNTEDFATSNTVISDGNWHLIGVSQSGNMYTYYLDGQPDGTFTTGTPAIYDDTTTGAIGYDPEDFVVFNNGHFFNGSIDEVGVWTSTLSASDWQKLYNGGVGRQYPF